MQYNLIVAALLFAMFDVVQLTAQQVIHAPKMRNLSRNESSASVATAPKNESPENEYDLEVNDDPAYSLYKEGYRHVLDEDWKEAQKTFGEVIAKYAKSQYIDDAKYWSAYALKHIDWKKAITAYKSFIQEYPQSTYYDDAVADLNDMENATTITTTHADSLRTFFDSKSGAYSFSYGKNAKRQLERQLRSLRPMRLSTSRLAPVAIVSPRPFPDKNVDQETRLKMDALYALGETKEDDKSYQTLKDIAIDQTQPLELRTTALDALAEFKKHDVLAVYLEIAKKDTSEEIQNTAIDFISTYSKDKNRSAEALIQVFNGISQQRHELQATLLYAIAEIGNDKSVEFLSSVARSNKNYELRSDAVYYLGNIGGEKARTALYDILKGKK